jgi:hypothetical protein
MDDGYLKMVMELPNEFFTDWQYEDGDKFWLTLDDIDLDISPSKDHGEYTVFDGKLATDGVHDTENWYYVKGFSLQEGRPIPSQGQLQEMLINFNMKNNAMSRKRAILHVMGWWADYLTTKHDFEYEKIQRYEDYNELGDPEDFDILMLKFTVGNLLLLQWNGKKWIKL